MGGRRFVAELSGFEVLVLLKELNSGLRSSYVNNVYSLGDAQLLRFRKPEDGDSWLVVSPSKGVWISERVSEREETSDFTSKLRGELVRAKFLGASQEDLDRVFRLEFEGAVRKTLIVELMPPGNILVVNEEGRIVLLKNEVRSQSRRLFRGGAYSPPAQARLSPLLVRPEDVLAMIREESTVGRAIGKHIALPRKYVSETARRMSVAEADPAVSLAGREGEVVRTIREMVDEASSRPAPAVVSTETGEEVFVVKPRGLESEGESVSLSSLCDRLFLDDLVEEPPPGPEEAKRRELEATVARLARKEGELLVESERLKGLAQQASRSSSLEEALGALARAGMEPKKDMKSAPSVASSIYDGSKEAERKALDARLAAVKLRKKSLKVREAPRRNTRQLTSRRAEWYERFRWFFTGQGKLAVGGRDAQSNSLVLKRHLESRDTVYHADIHGSPFFVLKEGVDQTQEEVREVAQATVAFSSAWKTGLGSADAYWVTPDQVSSAAPSGEYLPRGSFAVKGKKNFVNRNLVEISVGLDDGGRVVSGPESAVKKACRRYVVLSPHREKASETAKKVLSILASPEKAVPPAPSLDEVLRALPSGGGKVRRREGP
jgi:predicted ribosome quality control (RQC) complex YloA/Tae2 family protein